MHVAPTPPPTSPQSIAVPHATTAAAASPEPKPSSSSSSSQALEGYHLLLSTSLPPGSDGNHSGDYVDWGLYVPTARPSGGVYSYDLQSALHMAGNASTFWRPGNPGAVVLLRSESGQYSTLPLVEKIDRPELGTSEVDHSFNKTGFSEMYHPQLQAHPMFDGREIVAVVNGAEIWHVGTGHDGEPNFQIGPPLNAPSTDRPS